MLSNTTRFSVATFALAFAVPVFAGGGANIPVRIKNVGFDPVGVNAKSGSATQQQLQQGAVVVASNGIAQFNVKAGAFTAVAADPDAPTVVNKVRNFNTRQFKTIYLWAQQDYTTATLVGAPGGVKF
jgi:hypothetical protein